MTSSWKWYLFLIIVCLVVQGFFAMMEMASVSFNKVRLQYFVSKNMRRAKWLSYLLSHPPLLFGTTLIGVNSALQLGSESARRLYDSLHLNPDFAPLTQVFLVLIFAEIAPLIAGRKYSEDAAMLGIPLLYVTSFVLRPFIWFLELLCHLVNRLLRSPTSGPLHLSRDELQKMLEAREESTTPAVAHEWDTVASNIFSLKNKTAKDLMKPIAQVKMISSGCTVGEMRASALEHYEPFLPIYHKVAQNIIAMSYPRDVLRLGDSHRVREAARPPWFITEGSSVLQILKQFRRNNQSVAVVLSDSGYATGILTLDEICDEIFQRVDSWMSFSEMVPRTHHIVVDRTFSGDLSIEEFNEQFHVSLPSHGAHTLEELVTKTLGHLPEKGEVVKIDQFELTVAEVSLLGVKMIAVRTVF